MGRFLKPDNLIPDITNPQNWNAYTYVKGNPVNFNDPSGHYGNAGMTKQVLFGQGGALGLSPAYGGMWENPQEKGTLSGVDAGYYGGAEYSGSELGYWEQVPYETGYGTAYYDSNGELVTTEPEEWFYGAGWVFRPTRAVDIGGGRTNYTEMRAQPIPKTYVMAMPPSKFHLDRFFYLNANPNGMYNTLATVTMSTTVGVFWGSRTGNAGGVFVGGNIGLLIGFIIVESEYIALSIYPEGWVPPSEPSAPPPGLGSFNKK